MDVVRVRIVYNSRLLWFFPRRFTGFTLGPTIRFRRSRQEVGRDLINHELIHVCQYQDRLKEGYTVFTAIMSFLGHYLFPLNQAYRDKPEEREAYTYEHDFLYIKDRWPCYWIVVDDGTGGKNVPNYLAVDWWA